MDEESRDLYEEDEIIEAVKRFKKMVRQKHVSYFDVFEFEGIADHFMDEGRLKLAKKAVAAGLHMHPSSTALLLKKAQIFAYDGKPEKCLKLVKFLGVTMVHAGDFGHV